MRTIRYALLILLLSPWFAATAQHGRVAERIQDMHAKGVAFAPTTVFTNTDPAMDDRVLDAALKSYPGSTVKADAASAAR